MKPKHLNNRREFLKNFAFTLSGAALAAPLLSLSSSQSAQAAQGAEPRRKLGVALVGLGKYSATQLAPALQQTKNCYLAGIVTGTPAKAQAWKSMYKIPEANIYSYDTFDQIAKNKDIDIVYVVLPNSLHAEYVIRAARAKKYVICEKPMATSVKDAERMVAACRENSVQLAVGYRLHFEPFNQRVMELGQKKVLGRVRQIQASDCSDMTKGSLDVWRLRKDLAGGGPLMDLGIYCVQAACYTTGKTPVAVTARFGEVTHPAYFYDVEQSIRWKMEFGDGVVAECKSAYDTQEDLLSAKAEKGWWRVSPAYGYEGQEGETSQGKMALPHVFEQVRQMDAQAESFRRNLKSVVPGEMGLRDVKILMAIYESARADGKRIRLTGV